MNGIFKIAAWVAVSFCSIQGPAQGAGVNGQGKDKQTAGLNLIGVLIGSEKTSLAVIADQHNKKHYLRVGDKVPSDPNFILESIKKGRVTIRSGAQRFDLTTAEGVADLSRVQPSSNSEPSTSSDQYALERSMLEKIRKGELTQWEDLGENRPEAKPLAQQKKENQAELKKRVGPAFTDLR